MIHPPSFTGYGPIINRLHDIMEHIDRFSCHGPQRLVEDTRVSPSSISRLIHNQFNPSFALVARVTAAIEREVGFHIDPRDVVAEDGDFLTPYVCDLMGCRGCLPRRALNDVGEVTPAFKGIEKGQWETSRYPKGFDARKEGHGQ